MRDAFLEFRLSKAEKLAIEKKAQRADLSASDLIRREVGLPINRRPPVRPTALLEHFRKTEETPGRAALERLSVATTDESQTE